MQLATMDFIRAHGKGWDRDEVNRLRKYIDKAKIRILPAREMEGLDGYVTFAPVLEIGFLERPTCSWIQVVMHELAHVIEHIRCGDGLSHSPMFFRTYRRLLNLHFASTETVQFVALERLTPCAPFDGGAEEEGGSDGPED